MLLTRELCRKDGKEQEQGEELQLKNQRVLRREPRPAAGSSWWWRWSLWLWRVSCYEWAPRGLQACLYNTSGGFALMGLEMDLGELGVLWFLTDLLLICVVLRLQSYQHWFMEVHKIATKLSFPIVKGKKDKKSFCPCACELVHFSIVWTK